MVVVSGNYQWLEEEDDHLEIMISQYDCKYYRKENEDIDVACKIKRAPTPITSTRSFETGLNEEKEQRFNGVWGFNFTSEKANTAMHHKEIESIVRDEVTNMFDFIRNPVAYTGPKNNGRQ